MEYKEIEDDEYSTVTTTNQKLSWVYFIIFMSLLGLVYIYYIDSQHIRKNTSSRIPSRRTPADNKIISNITVPPSSRIPSRRTPADNKNISDITASGDFQKKSEGITVYSGDFIHDFDNSFDKYDTFQNPSVGSGKTFTPESRNFDSSISQSSRNFGSSGSFDSFRSIPYGSSSQRYSSSSGTFRPG